MTAPAHGSIRLIEPSCTSCMICARECPSWCITIDSHQEPVAHEASAERESAIRPGTSAGSGGRARTENVLDRFAIDWSLCMYCGICVEECPFDALEWVSPHTVPAADLRALTHEIPELTRPHS